MIRFFLDRHLLVHVITIMVLGLGAIILGSSRREGFPAVTINEVIISAVLPGASPEDVETKLVRPIEEAVRDDWEMDSRGQNEVYQISMLVRAQDLSTSRASMAAVVRPCA